MTRTTPTLESHLPLKPLDFAILLVLAREPSYGYGMVKAVSDESAGAIRLAPGNLYQVLDRMIGAGLVREAETGEIPIEDEDERRHYYALTGLGRRVAAAEASRLRAVMGTADALGLVPEGGGE